jgi:membrane associated rhomboid family serine protease
MTEVRPGGFQILPPVIKNIIIINAIFFLATNILGDGVRLFMYRNFALFHWDTPFFKPWQLVTHMFMHGTLSHLFFNMFAFWMFGNSIENYLGLKRFLIFYFVSGIGAAVCFLLTQTLMGGIQLGVPMVGASGAVFGVLFAFGYLFPNVRIYFYFLIPIKAKYFVALYALLELWLGIGNNPGDNVAHFAHLGGMLFAFILFRIWGIRSNKYA